MRKGIRLGLGLIVLLALATGSAFPAIAQPSPVAAAGGQLESECRNNLSTLLRACQQYAQKHDGDYPDSLDQLTPEFVKSIPVCPAAGRDSYSALSCFDHHPERVVLICSFREHSLFPADYLVLSSERAWETPYAQAADPTECRRNLVSLGQRLEQIKEKEGRYPDHAPQLPRCSCGASVSYGVTTGGTSFTAACPGAAHLAHALAPFSPAVGPAGLTESSMPVNPPLGPQAEAAASRPLPGWMMPATLVAVLCLVGLAAQGYRHHRRRLD